MAVNPEKYHMKNWLKDDVALYKFSSFLCTAGFDKDAMKSLANIVLKRHTSNSGELSVESELGRGREITDAVWMQELLKQWRRKKGADASTEKLLEFIVHGALPIRGDPAEIVRVISEQTGCRSPVMPSVDASDSPQKPFQQAGHSFAAAGAAQPGVQNEIYVDPSILFKDEHRLRLITDFSAQWKNLVHGLFEGNTTTRVFEYPDDKIKEIEDDCSRSSDRMSAVLSEWRDRGTTDRRLYEITNVLIRFKQVHIVRDLLRISSQQEGISVQASIDESTRS